MSARRKVFEAEAVPPSERVISRRKQNDNVIRLCHDCKAEIDVNALQSYTCKPCMPAQFHEPKPVQVSDIDL